MASSQRNIIRRILLAILFIPLVAYTQNLSLDWVNGIQGSSGDEIVQNTTLDEFGNVYIAGSFKGTVNFNPSGTATNLTSLGGSDAFFAKYDTDGNLIWANRLGSTGDDEINSIRVDASGNVYVIGFFSLTMDFDPGAATSTLTSKGSLDIFYGKYTSGGALVWANAHGSTGLDRGFDIRVDGNSNVYVTGKFTATVDFDPSTSVNSKISQGGLDIFLGKFSSTGTLIWIDTFGSTSDDSGNSIDLNSTGVLIGGYYSGNIDLDPGSGTSVAQIAGVTDGFFARYNQSDGNWAWWSTIKSTGADEVTQVLVSGGNIYVAGVFSGTATFATGTTRISNGGTDGFIAKYEEATRNVIWVNAFGGVNSDQVYSIARDNQEGVAGSDVDFSNVYATGSFLATVDFDPSSNTANLVSTGVLTDAFICSYTSAGVFRLANRLGTPTGSDVGSGITADMDNDIYWSGVFQNTVSFDFSSSDEDITSLGAWDGFIAKYENVLNLLDEEPTAPPTNLVFSNKTTNFFNYTFTHSVSTHTGYIHLRKAGSAPTFIPDDGVVYEEDDILPDGSLLQYNDNIPTNNFSSGLTPGTTYYYKIYVYNGSGTSINYLQSSPLSGDVTTVSTPPAITDFTPKTGPVGTSVTITGTNFSTTASNNIVKFNGTVATITGTPSATSIIVPVPAGATTGKITIDIAGQVATSSADFTVSNSTEPAITDFSPKSGLAGTVVIITGTNFSSTPSNNTVTFNNVAAIVTASTTTSITTTVPATGTTGAIAVTVAGKTATSATNFSVVALANEPSGQPANLVFSKVKSTSYSYSYSAPAAPPDGYIQIRKTGSAPAETPVDGVVYTPVQTLGTSSVMYVGTGTTFDQGGAVPGTTYHLAIYSYNGSGTSINYKLENPARGSIFIPLTDPTVQITNETFVTTYNKGGTLTVSITIDDPTSVSKVNFKSRGISEAASASKSVEVTAVGNKYEKVVAAADLTDPIGLIYSFQVIDKNQAEINSSTGKAFIKATDQTISDLSFGSAVSNYQIIAVPLELTNKNVTSVFSSLMPYTKSKWRLFDYANNDNREYSAFSTIEPGKGYWLIVKSSTVINPGEGKSVTADEATPFTINLTAGWNLIGNPYNFRVSWTEVLAFNSNPAGVSDKLKLFSGGALIDGTVLEKYRGAFVFANNPVALKIPVTRNTSLGGRMNTDDQVTNALDESYWEVKLKLSQGLLSNQLGGIGMHPSASLQGKDSFDEVSVPLPEGLGLFELSSPHPEVFTGFNKDIVPSQHQFTWEFNVKRDSPDPLELSWQNDFFGDNDKGLVVFNPTTLEVVDLRLQNHYVINKDVTKLNFIYGNKSYIKSELDKYRPSIGIPYPNPSLGELTIPFRVSEDNLKQSVSIKIYNSLGAEIAVPVNGELSPGTYEAKWDSRGEKGLYLVRMQIGKEESKVVKVVVH